MRSTARLKQSRCAGAQRQPPGGVPVETAGKIPPGNPQVNPTSAPSWSPWLRERRPTERHAGAGEDGKARRPDALGDADRDGGRLGGRKGHGPRAVLLAGLDVGVDPADLALEPDPDTDLLVDLEREPVVAALIGAVLVNLAAGEPLPLVLAVGTEDDL